MAAPGKVVMTDPIRDALERLVNTSEVRDWDTSEARNWQWHVAMCYARQVLADTPRAVLGAQPPADAPSPAPVAWCSSIDFLAAAEKRQSFSGWRERYSDCDMALYAAPAPMAWPELPDCPEEWRAEDIADTAWARGIRCGWAYARRKLAAMNPNHQQENQ